jgi:hypothetical protein
MNLAEVTDYAGLITALRVRARDQRIALGSHDIACVAGLPDRYITKLLAPQPTRRLGMVSLGSVLAVLGVKLVLVEGDRRAMDRLPKIKDGQARLRSYTISGRTYREIGKKGGLASNDVRARKKKRLCAQKLRKRCFDITFSGACVAAIVGAKRAPTHVDFRA